MIRELSVLAMLMLGDQVMADQPSAALEIEAVRDEVRMGEPVLIRVSIVNRGNEPLWLNQRLSPNSPFAPLPLRELILVVVGPNGRWLRFQPRVNMGRPDAEDFCVLPPDEAVAATIDLATYHEFDQEGVHTVWVRHKHGSPDLPPTPEGARLFVGLLVSNQVEIRIVR